VIERKRSWSHVHEDFAGPHSLDLRSASVAVNFITPLDLSRQVFGIFTRDLVVRSYRHRILEYPYESTGQFIYLKACPSELLDAHCVTGSDSGMLNKRVEGQLLLTWCDHID
jgi:hypothetical protein